MFIKPFRVKSQSQMKGSDKKKLRSRVKNQFQLLDSEESNLESLLPTKEETTVTKIYTHNGESVIVYSVGKDPLFFEIDKQMIVFPTVYTLWKFPSLLQQKFLSTVAGVVPKLASGADLMLPGVVADVEHLGMNAYCNGKLQKGEILYINLINNKAAVAVGTALHSSEDLYLQGMRGKAVNVLHCVGDHLWIMGNKGQSPDLGSIEVVGGLVSSIQSAVSNLLLDPNDNNTSRGSFSDSSVLDNSSNQNVTEHGKKLENKTTDSNKEGLDTESNQARMDALIESAFLQALRTTAKKLELPVLTSTFYRQHMLPACPNDLGGPIDLKKSSYKKLGKFLSKMMDEDIITLKEEKKGVKVIASIDYGHDKVLSFRPIKCENQTPFKTYDNRGITQFVLPKITELYLVTAQVANFFNLCDIKKGEGITATEVRTCTKLCKQREASTPDRSKHYQFRSYLG